MADDDSQGESGGSAQNRMPAAAYEVSRKGLNAFAVSPDGSRLATAARDGTVRIHELTSGAMLAGFRVRLPLSCHCHGATISMSAVVPPDTIIHAVMPMLAKCRL